MSNVNVKYLKDESGNKFSPVTSFNSVYSDSNNKLSDVINGTSLYDGNTVKGFTLSQSCANFRHILIRFEFSGVTGYTYCCDVNSREVSLVLSLTFSQYKLARHMYKTLGFSGTNVTVAKSGYLGITEDKSVEANSSDSNGIVIRKVVGFKN